MRKHIMAMLALTIGTSLGFAHINADLNVFLDSGNGYGKLHSQQAKTVVLSQDQSPGEGFDIHVLAEKEVAALPAGALFWRIETFPTLEAASAAAGPWGLAADTGGEAWLFTLHPQGVDEAAILQAEGQPWLSTLGSEGGQTPGGTLVAEVGPLPEVLAPSYLLRIAEATAGSGSSTLVHSHPGTEAFYALAGVISVRTAEGVMTAQAEQAMAGHAPGTAMQVFNGGSTELHGLIMFVVDATSPFSSPTEFP